MFDAPIVNHLKKDAALSPLLDRPWIRPEGGSQGLVHDLISAIISQQISTAAARTVRNRLLERLDQPRFTVANILSVDEDFLRSAGLSRQKTGYVINIANHFDGNPTPDDSYHSMSDEDIINDLTQIKGVGRWTVEMILMHTFQRPDVFPTADLGIQNAMKNTYGIDKTGKELIIEMKEIAENWRPFRTYACWALWNSLY